jgi:prolipoprotein diacylglyceryltransferase
MYPSLYYAIKDLLGLDIPFFKVIQMFGFFVAIAFITAAYLLTKELKRKESEGLLGSAIEKKLKGEKASLGDLISSGIVGFLIGYKVVYILFNFSAFTENTQGFLLSTKGSLVGGIICGIAGAYLKFREKEKTKLETPVMVENKVQPHELVGNMTLIAALFGLLGAKIFHNLENWDKFTKDPIGSLLSFDGLTMYGGLIVASIAVIYYGKKKNISIPHLIDAAAPALMIAYAIGRIGCQLSGDGDWGILNSAYLSNPNGTVTTCSPAQFQTVLENNQSFYLSEFESMDKIHHLSVHAPSFLPDWMFAFSYPHNVVHNGIDMAGCTSQYCSQLPIPVFPTPFYETIACAILFFILWAIRKRIKTPGMLFCIYLIFNGFERFFIEKIRVNTLYHVGGLNFTQAELISTILFFLGLIGIFYFKRLQKNSFL